MHETPHGFFHLDEPADGAVVPAGPVLLRGWVAATGGLPFADLRVRTAAGVQPAVLGFPRADLAAHFKLRDPFLPGGFEASVALPAGPQEIRFEGLNLAGQWHELGVVKLTGTGDAPAPAPAPAPAIPPADFARALRHAARRAAQQPVKAAAAEVAGWLPQPASLRYPHLPFRGHLHEPVLLRDILFGRLFIDGWLFHATSAVRRVVASVDLQVWQELTLAGKQGYVTAQFPESSNAKDCAISGWIDVPAQLPCPLTVRVCAQLADGSWHLCQVHRAHLCDQEQKKAPMAAIGLTGFASLVLALRRACRARGFAVPWTRELGREIRAVYGEVPAAPPAAVPPAADLGTNDPAPRHVTLVTHNLDREGAPLFLLELAHHLAAQGTRLRVIAAQDGPLAANYTALGAEVRVVNLDLLTQAPGARELERALEQFAPTVPLADTDLVIANTLAAWWGVHLAKRAGRPSLFYIHESTTPATFYHGHLPPAVLPVIEHSLRLATHVSFLTESTRIYYRPWLGASNHGINPGWIDLRAIESFLATHDRNQLRRELAVDADTRLVINLGTVCDRKGQHIFARGVDLFWRQAPALAATCRFVMVGGHDTPFDRDTQNLLRQLDRPNLSVVPVTATPLAWYGAADLFVCSSYEESFPRVIMEAMACSVPILSTHVHGIRDMLESGRDAWLVPPGDSHALATGLASALADRDLASTQAAQARARVTAFDSRTLLPRHAALAARIAAQA